MGKRRDRAIFDLPFQGTLAAQGREAAFSFRLLIRDDGELDIRFHRRRMTRTTDFVRELWQPSTNALPDFSLRGHAPDGTLFETDDLHFTSLGERISGIGRPHTMKPSADCGRAIIRMQLKEPAELPVLKWRLKGFECFPPLYTECPLGKIKMAGETRMAEPGPLNGLLILQASSAPDDIEAWRKSADKLLEHIRRIMSFASSTMLGAPIAEFAHGDCLEVEALSQSAQRSPAMRVFHKLNLQPALDAAIASYFEPSIAIENLFFAIEWFTMASTYDEVRLVAAMTALENLIDSNLAEADALVMPPRDFEKVRRGLRGIIRSCLIKWTEVDADDLLPELNEKLGDLNRRALQQKLYRLAKQWQVPLDGISEGEIRQAITARNMVVHRGHNPRRDDGPDLWHHVTVVREIVVRFLLTAIGYRGQYISHIGGYHFAEFPPASVNDATT